MACFICYEKFQNETNRKRESWVSRWKTKATALFPLVPDFGLGSSSPENCLARLWYKKGSDLPCFQQGNLSIYFHKAKFDPTDRELHLRLWNLMVVRREQERGSLRVRISSWWWIIFKGKTHLLVLELRYLFHVSTVNWQSLKSIARYSCKGNWKRVSNS